jgi:hypothetical protein
MDATATLECQTHDVKSSATELGVCEETVRRLVRRKVLRKLPGLRRILIPRGEIYRYLNASHESVELSHASARNKLHRTSAVRSNA